MRLGSRSPDEFIQLLNKKNDEIQKDFLEKMIEKTKIANVKVMMGDSTITEQKTFDPNEVSNYLESIIQKLDGWSLQNVSTTNNEEIVDITKNKETELSDNSDQFVLDKLKEMGYKDFDHQKLFEIFYEDEEFSKKVYAEIEKESSEEFKKLTEKKNKLIKELDSLLIETYQTSSVLIDDTR